MNGSKLSVRYVSERAQVSAKAAACAALLLCACCLSGCQSDSYDTGDGPLSGTEADFAEAHTNSGCMVDYVLTDTGDKLALQPPVSDRQFSRPDTLYRCMMYFNRLEGGKCTVSSISVIPTLLPAEKDEVETMLTHPLTFESLWQSDGGKYINMGFWLKVGQTTSDARPHRIGVVRKQVTTNTDGTTTTLLHLFHDQGDVPEHYSQKYYASIPARLVATDSVAILVNTYGGEKEYRISLKPLALTCPSLR